MERYTDIEVQADRIAQEQELRATAALIEAVEEVKEMAKNEDLTRLQAAADEMAKLMEQLNIAPGREWAKWLEENVYRKVGK